METTTLSAPVDLSRRHDGQIITHHATMRAEGYYRPGRPRQWTARRWQVMLVTIDTSLSPGGAYPAREQTETSPWYASRDEAEAWLEQRGLLLGGAYWHGATILD